MCPVFVKSLWDQQMKLYLWWQMPRSAPSVSNQTHIHVSAEANWNSLDQIH